MKGSGRDVIHTLLQRGKSRDTSCSGRNSNRAPPKPKKTSPQTMCSVTQFSYCCKMAVNVIRNFSSSCETLTCVVIIM
jgi:hypothetical protein